MIKENKNIKYLIGNNTLDLKSTIPYSDIFCDFLDNFSKALDSYPQIRKFPDLKTLFTIERIFFLYRLYSSK